MLFTKKFKVRKNQPELDFVNVDLSKDTRLFIDPYAVSQRRDLWSIECHTLIRGFFQLIVDNIRSGQLQKAKDLLSFFKEPNETRLGFSSGKPMGAGIGNQQATQLFNAIKDSSAVKTGFINSLEECELMIEGISRDKISDLTTNIIRKKLEEYTVDQCHLHNVAVSQVAVAPYFSIEEEGWVNNYYTLPVADSKPVLLVPKSIVRYSMDYDSGEYYNQYIINYLQAEHIRAGSSLAKTLKSGQKVVYKKDVKGKHPFSKKFLYEFSKENPKVLEKYREDLKLKESNNESDKQSDPEDFATGQFLIETIGKIPPGNRRVPGKMSGWLHEINSSKWPSVG